MGIYIGSASTNGLLAATSANKDFANIKPVGAGLLLHYDFSNSECVPQETATNNLVSNPDNGYLNGGPIVGGRERRYHSFSSGYNVIDHSVTNTALTGQNVRLSYYMKSSGGASTYLMYMYTGTGGDGGWYGMNSGGLTDQWVRYDGGGTGYGGTVTTIRIYRLNQTGTIDIACPQLELQSSVTPFTIGSRGSTVYDLSGNGFNGTLTNGAYYSTTNGGCIVFDGSNDYIETNSNSIINGNNPFTIEVFYTISGSGGGALFGNYGPSYTSGTVWFSGQYGLYINGSAYASGAPFSSGTRHMVSTRDSSGNAKTYMNGVLSSSATLTASVPAQQNFRIGTDVNGTGEPFTGNLYILRVYNRALSTEEVYSNYNQCRARFSL
jgi:hypothetical protein